MPRQIPEIRRASARVLIAVSVLLLGLGAVAPNGSAGNVGCGTISFSFEGTRLLNDGISESAGPFGIELPGGTYDVMMRSADHHSEQGDQTGQEAERWWFSLDSGYRSSPTDDLPDDRDANATTLLAQPVPDSRSITVHHLGEGGVNSINPVCVGFTPSPGEQPDLPDPQDPDQPGDPADDPDRAPGGPDGGDPDDDPDRAIPDPGDPDDPTNPGDDPGDAGDDPERAPGDPAVEPGGTEPDPDEPDRAIPDPDDPTDPDDAPAPGPEATPGQPVVPELAITGPTSTARLLGLAVILVQLGFLFVLAGRGQPSSRSSQG